MSILILTYFFQHIIFFYFSLCSISLYWYKGICLSANNQRPFCINMCVDALTFAKNVSRIYGSMCWNEIRDRKLFRICAIRKEKRICKHTNKANRSCANFSSFVLYTWDINLFFTQISIFLNKWSCVCVYVTSAYSDIRDVRDVLEILKVDLFCYITRLPRNVILHILYNVFYTTLCYNFHWCVVIAFGYEYLYFQT